MAKFFGILVAVTLLGYSACARNGRTVPASWIRDIQQNGRNTPLGKDATGDPMKIVCYFPWHGTQDLIPEKADTSYCTHVITGFATVVKNGTVVGDLDIYKQVAGLKSKQPDLKVMVSIGGGEGMSDAVSTQEARSKLIQSIFAMLDECGLDGVDIDWEFPSWMAPADEKPNFALFLKDFRAAAANTTALLSVAVAAEIPIIFASYDVPALAKYTDFINLMSYGFHGYHPLTDPFTGFNSPLFPRAVEKAYFSTLNLAWSANYWVQIGVPRSKVMVGIPTYAHTYTLANASMTWPDAPAVAEGGDMSYSQVCDFLKSGAKTYFDNESKVPYAVKDLQWVSYENEESITAKATWVKNNNFGGAMTFDLNADDWQRKCGDVDFPLHKIIHSIFNN